MATLCVNINEIDEGDMDMGQGRGHEDGLTPMVDFDASVIPSEEREKPGEDGKENLIIHNHVNVVLMSNAGRRNGLPATRKGFKLPPRPSPTTAENLDRKMIKPFKPELELDVEDEMIVLKWKHGFRKTHAKLSFYEIYFFQQPLIHLPGENPTPEWKLLGDVGPLDLPMSCTLNPGYFTWGNKYHFIIRGVDIHNQSGPFSDVNWVILGSPQPQGSA